MNDSPNSRPLISIITVTKNCAATLEQTLASVRAVKSPLIEYLIIDGVSTDGTLDLIAQAGALVDVLISEPDSGVYNAMNKGVKAASGQYLIFINGDDQIESEGFLQAMVLMQSESPAVLACCSRLMESDRDKVDVLVPVPWKLRFFNSIPHPSSFVSAHLLRKYRFREDLRIASDYDLFLRLYLDHYAFRVCNAVTAIHYRGGLSGNEALSSYEVERVKRENLGAWGYGCVRVVEQLHRLRKYCLASFLGSTR